MTNIAVVVPTCREEQYKKFRIAWQPLFDRHGVTTYTVIDGDTPGIKVDHGETGWYAHDHPWRKFCFNHNDGVRNLGFLAALSDRVVPDVIITLDDDVIPELNSDPIQDHLDALSMRVPISWFSTASEYMRGFPYGVRSEAEVWVSHGVWSGVHDYDGPTQLVNGIKPATFYKGPIPRGCLTPVCGMNLAFKIEVLPYVYFAPMGDQFGVKRFADIWMGVGLKRHLDDLNKAMVTGYSSVRHERASNVFNNLQEEAVGIKWNEELRYEQRGTDNLPYAQLKTYNDKYMECAAMWQDTVRELSGGKLV